MDIWRPEIVSPIAGTLMVVLIVAVISFNKTRQRELQAHADLRAREMEHDRRMKELEVEKTRLELEKTKLGRSVQD